MLRCFTEDTFMTDLDTLRYPVGRFARLSAPIDAAARAACLDIVERAPARYRALATGRSERELDTPYRPGGWTVRQVLHHVPDSHLNAYIRMKLALTEDTPAVKTYDETKWAELHEAKSAPAEVSLALLEALHRRWVLFMRGLSEADFRRPVMHPEWKRIEVGELLAQYSWHCRHHEAHVRLGLGEPVSS
jgi:hypothetical protein